MLILVRTKEENTTSFLPSGLKFMFSKKATKIDEIFTVDLTLTTYVNGEDFVNFCSLLIKHELYLIWND